MGIQPLARRNQTATLTASRAAPLCSCLPPPRLGREPTARSAVQRVAGFEPAAHEI
jgi:hypothetical protein